MHRQMARNMRDFVRAINSDNGALLVSIPGWATTAALLRRLAVDGKVDCLEAILKSNADFDVDIVDSHGGSAFMCAVQCDQLEVVRTLLRHRDRRPINVNRQTTNSEYKSTSLCYAMSVDGNVEMVKELLTVGELDVNYQCALLGATPMMTAVAENQLAVVRLLLNDARIDVNAQDRRGNTALHLAVSLDNLLVIALLMERTDTTLRNKAGATVRDLAAVHDDLLIRRWIDERLRRKAVIDGKGYRAVIDYRGEVITFSATKKLATK